MRLDCITAEEAIWDNAREGVELPSDVLSHIERCRSCSQALADVACSVGTLRQAVNHPPAPDCRGAVMNRIAGTRTGLGIWKPAWALGPAIAAAAVILLWHIGKDVTSAPIVEKKAPIYVQKTPDAPLPVKAPTTHDHRTTAQSPHIQAKAHPSDVQSNVVQKQTPVDKPVQMASAAGLAEGNTQLGEFRGRSEVAYGTESITEARKMIISKYTEETKSTEIKVPQVGDEVAETDVDQAQDKVKVAGSTALSAGINFGRPTVERGEVAQERWQVGYDVHELPSKGVQLGIQNDQAGRSLSDTDAYPQVKAAARYGRLAYNRIIPVLISAGAKNEQDIVKLYWVTFRRERSIVHADVRAMVTSWPKGKWKIEVSLLDKAYKHISSSEGVLENQGIIIGIPCICEGDIRFDIGPIPPGSNIRRFRITISEAPQDAKVDKELTQTDQFPSQEKGDHSLEVNILDPDGEPAQAQWTLWRGYDGPVPEEPLTVFHNRPVYWKSHGLTWVPVRHVQGSAKLDDLAPGLYRVSAITQPSEPGSDTSPIGASDLIDLRKTTEASVNIQLQGGYPLTIKVIDEKSGKPIPREHILLRRGDGLPLSEGSYNFSMCVVEDGTAQFNSLEPGTYILEIGPRDWWYALHPETVKVVTFEVRPDSNNIITVPYTQNRWQDLMLKAE